MNVTTPHPRSVWDDCTCCWADCDCGCANECPRQRVHERAADIGGNPQ